MASLSHLSDGDLRKKLKEYGITSPVTSSTREILLKKLNHVMCTEKKSIKHATKGSTPSSKKSVRVPHPEGKKIYTPKNGVSSSLNTFSSDEEEEEEFPSPTRLRRSSRNASNSLNTSQTKASKLRDDQTPKSRQSVFSEDVSSSTIDRGYPTPPKYNKRKSFSYLYSQSKQDSSKANRNISRNGNDLQYDTCSDSDINIDGDTEDESNYTFDAKSLVSNEATTPIEPCSYRNFRSFDTSYELKQKGNNRSLSNEVNSYRGIEPKFPLSNRSNFSNNTMEVTSPEDIVSQEPMTAMNLHLANGQSPLDKPSKATDQSFDGSKWLQSVPLFLVILFTLFFGFLGVCYLNIHSPFLSSFQDPSQWLFKTNIDESQIKPKRPNAAIKKSPSKIFDLEGNRFPVCGDEIKISCLSGGELESVIEVIEVLGSLILPALEHHAGLYQCGDTSHHYLSLASLKTLLQKQFPQKEEIEILNGLTGLGKLVSLNPQLGLEAAWGDEADKDGLAELLGLATTVQATEILCHVTSAFYSLLYVIAAVLMGALATYLAIVFIRFYKKQAEEFEQRSFELVEQILEVLENSCGVSGKDFIAVNHVRDCLIPPRERKAKSSIWNRAVKFIDDHDSRVYREIRNVGGDDCEVWRWVSGAPRSPISCPPKSALLNEYANCTQQEKMWQGQAFESLEISQNLPHVSPTSCLKIRNMFECEIEFGDDWPRRIQDSLLEKCENVPIVHVAVDRASKEGCVYLKCANPKAAGDAFRALHGWWFDGNLVTVKYLRDERYYERFPTARLATSALTPSNNERLSLSQTLYPTLPLSDTSTVNTIASSTRRGTSYKGYYKKS